MIKINSTNEYQKLIYDWNNTQRDYPHDKTLSELFEAQVERTPHQIAVIYETQQLTYLELNQAANQLAHQIQRHISNTSDTPIIGLHLDRSCEMLIGVLAILKAGAAYVPIDPNYPDDRIDYMIQDTQTRVLLTQTHYLPALARFQHLTLIALDTKPYQNEAMTPPQRNTNSDSLAYLIYTSGTTGKPKGVMIPHRGVVNRLDWMQNAYPLTTTDVVLQKTPYSFDVSVWELFWAHQTGACLVIAKPKGHQDPDYLNALIRTHHISVIHFVPSMLSAFLYTLETAHMTIPPSLRFVFCSGEALALNQVQAFYALANTPVQLHNLYGPTEASIDVTAFACTNACTQVLIGKPIQNMQVYVLDEQLNPVAVGEPGELYLGGVGLAKGYLNQDELTQQRFIPNPFGQSPRLYKTGDLASWTADGQIDYLGRNDFQVKIRGHRIELGEIESVLTQFTGIRQAVVIAKSAAQPYLVAYYVSDTPFNEEELRQHLHHQLPEYMLPSAFMHLAEFPLSANGKLDRKALPEHEFQSNKTVHLDPQSELEKHCATVWSHELGIENIGIHDHFLALGGHSLIAARIVSTLTHQFKKPLSLPQFYQAGTVRNLAALLEGMPTLEQCDKANQTTHTRKNLPLNDFQLVLWLADLFESKAKKMNIVTRRRVQGTLDVATIERAFAQLFKDQVALSYRISKLYPAQMHQNKLRFSVTETSCAHLSTADYELFYLQSFNELFNLYPWPRNTPLVIARLFHLANGVSELQFCMPHFIADEFSMDVLCAHLSENYVNKPNRFTDVKPFKDYVIQEQELIHTQLDDKRAFWEHYLTDTRLFMFPKQHIINNMDARKLNYSTYLEIPQAALTALKQFCTTHQINLSDSISAILAKSLSVHCHETHDDQRPVLINLIKSTRDNPIYDQTIGCFVRVDPIKIMIDSTASLVALAQQVHRTIMDTAPHQYSSTLLKFACLTGCFQKKSRLLSWITRIGMPIYTKILRLFNLNSNDHRTLNLCWKLAGFDRKNCFIVNLNLWNNFVLDKKRNTEELFGLPTLHTPLNRYELSKLDTIFDVCFLRDESPEKTPYLVLSSNLTPEFREAIGQHMIQHMLDLMR
jgi:amino acid adenylation domain-containing protein